MLPPNIVFIGKMRLINSFAVGIMYLTIQLSRTRHTTFTTQMAPLQA